MGEGGGKMWRLMQIDRDQVWAALMADQDVYAMRLSEARAYALQDVLVRGVHKILGEKNVVYFTVWDIPEEGATDERPEN